MAAVPFELSDDGRTFLYRARPGEAPSLVARSFGIAPENVAAFLQANGIADATRVPADFVYRIPNPLAPEIQARTAEAEKLRSEAVARASRESLLQRRLAEVEAAAAVNAEHERRLVRLEWWRPIAIGVLSIALVGFAVALWIARLALGRLGGVERHARALAQEIDERRRAALAEKQEAARRVLDLEERLRQAERHPRLVASGRA